MGTVNTSDLDSSSQWSKDALFSLIAIFIMVFCTITTVLVKFRLLCKFRWDKKRLWWVKERTLGKSKFEDKCKFKSVADNSIDVEHGLPSIHSSLTHEWIDMRSVRKHQQRTYTTLIHVARRTGR